MKICTYCGGKMEDEHNFCASCGQPAEDEGGEGSPEEPKRRIPGARLNALLICLAFSLLYAVFMTGHYWPRWQSILGGGDGPLFIDGTPDLRLPGEGTIEDPYRIETAGDLERFARSVNRGNDYKGQFIRLMNDIDLSEILLEEGRGWTPIGNYGGTEFRGYFDGGDHTVSGLWIDTMGPANVGFFGYVEDAIVMGLNLRTAEGRSVKGKLYVGALAGCLGGKSAIYNCSAVGAVEVTQQKRSDGIFPAVGGLIGSAEGTVLACSASVDVTVWGEDTVRVGGLIGVANGNISRCQADGNVAVYAKDGYEGTEEMFCAGGLVGYSKADIDRCHASGDVEVTANDQSIYAGGLLGGGRKVSNCYVTGSVTVTKGIV